MATQALVKTVSERITDFQEKIGELRELFADAPEPGKKALENAIRELTSQLRASGLRMESAGPVARGPAARMKESPETHSDRFHYSMRRHEGPISPVCGRRSGMPVQAARRHDPARRRGDRVPARLEMTTIGTGIVTQSRGAAAPPVPFGKPEAVPIVFVADDNAAVREGLNLLIRGEGWHPELFVSARDFLSYPRPAVPCCLILDVNLPGLNGRELQEQLADRHDMAIVFISNCADAPLSVQAMKAGGVEFLTKPLQHDALLKVIRDAIGRSREALRLSLELQALRGCFDSLTRREREVMALVVSGLLNKQVGGELGISEITVKAHRSQVMRKMKAESLPDLVIMAARLGLRPVREHSPATGVLLRKASPWPVLTPLQVI